MSELKRVRLANGIELDVQDVGPKEGIVGNAPALVFLHGFPESHRTWRKQIPHLADRYRCIAPDQRGYRGSSKPQGVESYSPDKLIGDVFLLADALGVKDFTVIGHDWGGAIAWGVALGGQINAKNPKGRVTRAVIMNAPHPIVFQKLLYLDAHQRASSQYMRLFRDTAQDALVRQHGLAPILLKAFDGKLGSQPEPEEIAALAADWQDPDSAIAMLNWYRASPMDIPPMDAPFELPAGYAPFELPPLAIPTLVIWALDDIALPPANLDGLDALIPDLTIDMVPGCGHFVPWEAPDKVNAALDAFLARTNG